MKMLMQNMTNIYGKKGENWIANLPVLVAKLTNYWNLSNVIPVANMTFNYVAKAVLNAEQPVVLKINCNAESMIDEKQALMHFNANGSIKLIDFNEQYYALLLQQAVPGISLKFLYPDQIEYLMECYANTMKKLHSRSLPDKTSY